MTDLHPTRSRLGRGLCGAVLVTTMVASPGDAEAKKKAGASGGEPGPKPWCAPEVSELSDHVCWFDGGAPASGRRTLVIYLHGSLAPTPGFQYLQQRAMAIHAKRNQFTVLLPTSPNIDGYFVWPTGMTARRTHEGEVLAQLAASKRKLEKTMGVRFDETFVVGFSSGAYYASTLALRGALEVDGYVILAGGSSWARPHDPKAVPHRAPVFVGVSARDPQTREHSRAFSATLAALGWPHRTEERNAGHMVDWTFMDHGISWLRQKATSR